MDWYKREGSPSPLGATWIKDEQAFNFAIYSKHASSVTLLLYSRENTTEPIYRCLLDPFMNKSERVWHCRVPVGALPHARYYAYQIDGPQESGAGHRFDCDKILLDPYARSVFFPEQFSRNLASIPGNNSGLAPLGVLIRDAPSLDEKSRPRARHHMHDLVIYELHIRNFTMAESSGIAAAKRGTFAGLVEKIPYLTDLGVTAVELMPVTQQDPQEGSTWGYMPLGFFAPHHGYSCADATEEVLSEFRSMVDAFHESDIEVILDVVYNHTCEGGPDGPMYSFKGIDNSTYYLLGSDRRQYRNDSGTGNTLNCANRYVRKMIVDSLMFWANEMGVDGFRFDLASIFTRNEDGTINTEDPPVIQAINSALDLQGIRLIAEAWDPVVYQLGRTFPGAAWLQWNGRYRDEVRGFARGDSDAIANLMTRMYGSADLFPDDLMNAYHAYQSVNFITSHDGFSLYDWTAYSSKHNEVNGLGNTDGPVDNVSWNCGWEGDVGVPVSVVELRKRLIRFAVALLMLSNGTPMLRAGDEFLHTQKGNSNPYNQDNEMAWLDWTRLHTHAEMFDFFKGMIAFRKGHPSLCRSRFWRDDVRWYGIRGLADLSHDSRCVAFFLSGASEMDDDLYIMVNGSNDDQEFEIQELSDREWRLELDTAAPRSFHPNPVSSLAAGSHTVGSRSVVALRRPRAALTGRSRPVEISSSLPPAVL